MAESDMTSWPELTNCDMYRANLYLFIYFTSVLHTYVIYFTSVFNIRDRIC